MAARQLLARDGKLLLGPLLGRGGEGAVYEVSGRPDTVAKVYHSPVAPLKAEKLEAMVRMASPQLLALSAWPTDVLRLSNGSVSGLLMPRISGHKDIHTLYGPKSRRSEFPDADWRHLVHAATNTARAFAIIHEAGCVIGDVNHGGIRVAPNATVKLIDCDSFQIKDGGRHYLCEVGVENFTPPELQGKPFAGIIRTPNHDNFGLAVMIFNLLMMGRHPFAGRFMGREEMPVEKAIVQFRYAYGRDPASTQMQPPPHTAPVAIASPRVVELWERAFGRAGVQANARPTAKEWISALTSIQVSFVRCSAHAGHYYLKSSGSCPWCAVESATGAMLFSIPLLMSVATPGGAFNLSATWARISAVEMPLPIAEPVLPSVSAPSARAEQFGQSRRQRRLIGYIGLALFFVGLMFVAGGLWFVWLVAAFFAHSFVSAWVESSGDVREFKENKRLAEAAYKDAQVRWRSESASGEFARKRREIEEARRDLLGLPAFRQEKLDALMRNREANELRRYLERFEIDKAKVPGIGPAKVSMLESHGIEDAADVNLRAVMAVPGFGPALAQRMVAWRRSKEAGFRFNPAAAIDSRDLSDLDRLIAQRKDSLEKQLTGAASELIRIRDSMVAQRNAARRALELAGRAVAQAEADLKAVI